MIQFLLKNKSAVIFFLILIGIYSYHKIETKRQYNAGVEVGKAEVQKKYDEYVSKVKQAESDAKTAALEETERLQTEWIKKVEDYELKQFDLQNDIDKLRANNSSLSNDIKAYRARSAGTANKNCVTDTADSESETAWVLFENRRRADEDRIREAESINSQLILAKEYIDTVTNKAASSETE